MKYKLSYIIPLYNKGEEDFEYRLNTLLKAIPKIPSYVEVVIVEQISNEKLQTYTNCLLEKGLKFNSIIVNSDKFNKSWLYNIGVRNSCSNNLILAESDMDFNPNIFELILKKLNSKDKIEWFFCYNRIIYYNKDGSVWLNRKPEVHNTEGGLIYCDKGFYWYIGGMDENIVGMGGNDGHFIRRAEYITKSYPMLRIKIFHNYHPYNTEKRVDHEKDKIHKFNKEYYYKCFKDPNKVIKYLGSIIHYFGLNNGPYNRPFLLDNFEDNKQEINKVENNMITSVNLSLSSLCSAKCIFCPHKERGKNVKTKIMDFDTVKNIIDQIKSDNAFFSALQKIEVGEAGDCFLNKDIIKILRYIRQELPHVKINMFTNFNGLDNEKSDIILKERLIDYIWCNIDSLDKKKYYDTKHLDLNKVLKNIMYFFYNREKHKNNIQLNILILQLHAYIDGVKRNLNKTPINLNKSMDKKGESLSKMISKLADIIAPHDKMHISPIIYWAERPSFVKENIDYTDYSCPQLRRIKNEIFISPSGDSYLCCLDNRFDLLVGNVIKTSIKDVWNGIDRKALIYKLNKKMFKEIGYPCNTVNCCIKRS